MPYTIVKAAEIIVITAKVSTAQKLTYFWFFFHYLYVSL